MLGVDGGCARLLRGLEGRGEHPAGVLREGLGDVVALHRLPDGLGCSALVPEVLVVEAAEELVEQ
jgi:hypothetical protein